jgi:hypothetical protein
MGYGKTDAVADNTTSTGRQQNRRVEVKMIINRGLNQPTSSSQSVHKSSGAKQQTGAGSGTRPLLLLSRLPARL